MKRQEVSKRLSKLRGRVETEEELPVVGERVETGSERKMVDRVHAGMEGEKYEWGMRARVESER